MLPGHLALNPFHQQSCFSLPPAGFCPPLLGLWPTASIIQLDHVVTLGPGDSVWPPHPKILNFNPVPLGKGQGHSGVILPPSSSWP